MILYCVKCGKSESQHIDSDHKYIYIHDRCQVCKGASGGMLGNENIIEGRVVCDYCTVKYIDGKIDLSVYEKTRDF